MINQSFFVWDEGKYVRINLSEILIIESEGNYLRFHAMEYSFFTRATLDGTLSQLPDNLFARVHKSYAISLQHLEEVDKEVAKVGKVNVPISKFYYADLVSKLKVLNGG